MNASQLTRTTLTMIAAIGLTAGTAHAMEFDQSCFYSLDGKPEWTGGDMVGKRIPVGVGMTKSGGLIRLVPRRKLMKQLESAESLEAWLALFSNAPREQFKVHKDSAGKKLTPLDLGLGQDNIAAFRLFKQDWYFAPDPVTVGHEIPVLANGFKTHSTPFYKLNSPDASKVAVLGYHRDPTRVTKADCSYKYDLNLDIKADGFTTRVIIDPEMTSGSGGSVDT